MSIRVSIITTTFQAVPPHVWQQFLLPQLRIPELLQYRRLNTHQFNLIQQYISSSRTTIKIPNDCLNLSLAMSCYKTLSLLRKYNKSNPLRVQLGQGEFSASKYDKIVLDITMDNLEIIGRGMDSTKIIAEVRILSNRKNISISHLSITNPIGVGLVISGGRNIFLNDVRISSCGSTGIYMGESATLKASRLTLDRNHGHGLDAGGKHTLAKLEDVKITNNLRDGCVSSLGSVVVLSGSLLEVSGNRRRGLVAGAQTVNDMGTIRVMADKSFCLRCVRDNGREDQDNVNFSKDFFGMILCEVDNVVVLVQPENVSLVLGEYFLE